MKQEYRISKGSLELNGKLVQTRIVEVCSYFEHETNFFFAQEMIKKNTLRIVRPLITLSFQKENNDNEMWKEGFTYELVGKAFGIFKSGGIHYIHVTKIDQENKTITTIEKNDVAKIWNHSLTFQKIDDARTKYTDKVELHSGISTPLFARYLVWFYKVRHRNWNRLLTSLKNLPPKI